MKNNIDLSVLFCGIRLENPFILASAPPTANCHLIRRGFEAGWAGAVIKTIGITPSPTLRPRFFANKINDRLTFFGNIEQLSTKKLDSWIPELKKLRLEFPEKCLIISVMGVINSNDWLEILEKTAAIKPNMYEINLSCPHYIDDESSLSAGQSPSLAANIIKQAKEVTDIPIMPKLTSNVTDITVIGEAVKQAGADAISAINSVKSLLGINIERQEPEPSIDGLSAFGGLSGPAIKPIAQRCVVELVRKVGLPVSGMGGIFSWEDAVSFLMCGATTLQLATAVMFNGYQIINSLTSGLSNYLRDKGYNAVNEIIGIINNKLVEPSNLKHNSNIYYKVNEEQCTGCGTCLTACSDGGFEAISMNSKKKAVIDKNRCDGCSLCFYVCPVNCIYPVYY